MIQLGSATMNGDGDPLRLCSHNCAEPHFENCCECFGFGLKVGKTMPLVPVAAHEAFDEIVIEPRPCPECGSVVLNK